MYSFIIERYLDSIEEKMTSPQQKNETWNKQGVFYNKFEYVVARKNMKA